MSNVDIIIPSVGESVTEAVIEEWLKNSGDYVEKDEVVVTLETDKASVELIAEASGVLTTNVEGCKMRYTGRQPRSFPSRSSSRISEFKTFEQPKIVK